MSKYTISLHLFAGFLLALPYVDSGVRAFYRQGPKEFAAATLGIACKAAGTKDLRVRDTQQKDIDFFITLATSKVFVYEN